MANVQSNPTSERVSEFDFAEVPDDLSDEQGDVLGDIIQNPAIARMEPNLMMILSSFQLDNEIIERFANNGIKFTQLAGLLAEDLEMLGVTDKKLQDDMLTEFRSLEGQEQALALAMRNLRDKRKGPRNEMSVIDLIQGQLMHMNMLLAATILKVGAPQSSQSPGVVVGSSFNSPQLVLEMLQKMTTHANEMTDLIVQLRDQDGMQEKHEEMKKRSYKRIATRTLLFASGIAIGFFLQKYLRGGRRF